MISDKTPVKAEKSKFQASSLLNGSEFVQKKQPFPVTNFG
jgi:hypothetical protein